MSVEKFNSLMRPLSVLINGLALAFATVYTAVSHPEIFAVAGGFSAAIVGGISYLRSQDRKLLEAKQE